MKDAFERAATEQRLQKVLDRTMAAALAVSSAAAGRVCEDLVRSLASILGTDAALIGEFIDPGRTRMRTLAVWYDGRHLQNFEYDVAHSPCRHIVGRDSRFVASGVGGEFAPGTLFAVQGFDAYAGYSLFDASDNQVGLIVALDRRPLADPELTEALLKIFAVRAGAELQRRRAAAALQVSEASYRAIFEAAQDAMFVHDWDSGALADVNPRACEIYGYSREEMLRLSVAELSSNVPPYTLDEARRHIEAAKSSRTVRFEWHRRNKDGTLHWDEVVLQPVELGGVPRILAVTREITERKLAEQALRASETRLRATVDSALDCVLAIDAAGRVIEFNPAAEATFGRRRADVIGQEMAELLIPPRLREAHRAGLRRVQAGGAHRMVGRRVEMTAMRPDEVEFPIEMAVAQVESTEGPLYVGFLRDITERKRAEERLRASEEQYRAIFSASADAMVLRDEQLRVVDVNPAFTALVQTPKEELVGRVHPAFVVAPEREAAESLLRRALAGQPGKLQVRSLSRDGVERELEVRAMPMQYQGRPHVLTIARDITTERRAERESRRLEAQLRQAQKMEALGQLTGGIAHDFNNILASVMGYVVLAEERASERGDGKSVEHLGQALASCRRARDLIQQMLTFSRGGRGEPRAVDLVALVRDAAPMLRASLPSTLGLVQDCEPQVPPVWVDEVQAHQVLLNLAINARDAMAGAGTVRIGVRLRDATDMACASCRHTLTGEFVELSVADSGSGIPLQLIERIFDPFFTTKAPGKGSGMGLSTVHGIVHEYGGHVAVDSTVGQGTVFRVLWPVSAAAVRTAAEAVAVPHRRRLAGRVLLVDDEAVVLGAMRETIAQWGLEVDAHWQPEAALAAFEAAPETYDLVITDLAMPQLSGLELAAALRRRRHVPVLLASGFVDERGLAAARELGLTAVLQKPIEAQQLRAAVESALANRAAGSASR